MLVLDPAVTNRSRFHMISFYNLIGTTCARRRKLTAFQVDVARLTPPSFFRGESLGPRLLQIGVNFISRKSGSYSLHSLELRHPENSTSDAHYLHYLLFAVLGLLRRMMLEHVYTSTLLSFTLELVIQ